MPGKDKFDNKLDKFRQYFVRWKMLRVHISGFPQMRKCICIYFQGLQFSFIFLAMDQEILEEGITVLCGNTVFLMDLYSSLLMYLL